MNLANKTFRNLKSGQEVTIIDSLGDFAILKNGGKVTINELMDSNLYVENIDPNTFFTSHYDQFKDLAEKIVKTHVNKDTIDIVPPSNNYDISNESATFLSSIEDEKEELARKYGINNNSISETISKQNQAFERILNPKKEETYSPKRIEEEEKEEEEEEEEKKIIKMEDPIYHIFKNTKKSIDFNFSLKIEGKIPRLDFIEMMEDSYETSIIDFLSKEFTNKILSNPSMIEEQISSKIRDMVYNNKKENHIINEISDTNIEDKKEYEKPKRKYSRNNKRENKIEIKENNI
jgi:hypothetical protein